MHVVGNLHEGHSTVGEWQGRGRGTACERHGMCELAFNRAGKRHGMCESAFILNLLPYKLEICRWVLLSTFCT
jgi:hypothetical protein